MSFPAPLFLCLIVKKAPQKISFTKIDRRIRMQKKQKTRGPDKTATVSHLHTPFVGFFTDRFFGFLILGHREEWLLRGEGGKPLQWAGLVSGPSPQSNPRAGLPRGRRQKAVPLRCRGPLINLLDPRVKTETPEWWRHVPPRPPLPTHCRRKSHWSRRPEGGGGGESAFRLVILIGRCLPGQRPLHV